MSTPPLPVEEDLYPMKYKCTETYDFIIENNKYFFKISYNDKKLIFDISENNSLIPKEYSLCKNFEELKYIDKYFHLFESIEEVFNSFKRLISNNNLTLIKEEKQIKIKIMNLLTNRPFFLNVPIKENDINSKFDNLSKYIFSLNEKVNNLEKELINTKNENINLKKLLNIYENKITLLEKNFNEKIAKLEMKKNDNYMFKKSNIVKPEDEDLIISWFNKKPKKFDLLLDSKTDGDLNSTFYEKCLNKCPTIIFIQTTDNIRFGGFTSVTWPENENKKDEESFLFSLDKRKKYKIKKGEEENAIYYCQNVSFCFGSGCDLYICDKCTLNDDNQVGNGSYDLPSEYELNNGKNNFRVLIYEVYFIDY